jgi:hypothetical protein
MVAPPPETITGFIRSARGHKIQTGGTSDLTPELLIES